MDLFCINGVDARLKWENKEMFFPAARGHGLRCHDYGGGWEWTDTVIYVVGRRWDIRSSEEMIAHFGRLTMSCSFFFFFCVSIYVIL